MLAGIALVALTLRSAATAVSPLLDAVRADIGVTTTALGILGLLAPACFSVFGAITPALGRRLGLERALVLSLAVTAVGSLTRPLAGGTTLFLVLSAVTLAGMAMGNVLLPPIVKRYFPDRIGSVTGFYVVLIAVSAALPPYVALPLADALGWQASLASWGLVAVVAVLPWLGLSSGGRGGVLLGGGGLPVHRSRRAWGLTAMFGMTALNVYTLFVWLPDILTSAGVATESAVGLLGLYAAMGIPATVVVPVVAARMADPFPLIVLFAAFFWAGYLGLLVAPTAYTWLWVVLAGLGPATFPISIAAINLRTATEAGSGSLSGMVQGIGYAVAVLGPLGFGLLHDTTGSWTGPQLLLVGSVVFMLAGGWSGLRPGPVEEDLGWELAADAGR
ncbi:MFS transporter [soil metagenome]